MPVTTRNNGRLAAAKTTASESQDSAQPASSRLHPSPPSPYLLLIYPTLLIIGSLFSTISPSAVHSTPVTPLAAGISSDLNTPMIPAPANYFAAKHNLVNLYFVKIGWFWTTLAFTLLLATTRPAPPSSLFSLKQSRYLQLAIARYLLITLSWIFTTQWLFGPALIDRSFTITGGHCEAQPVTDTPFSTKDVSAISSGPACKAAGGRWRGGHDISGHIFMLVLSSAFLVLELYLADRHSSHPSVSPKAAAGVAADLSEEEKKAVGGWESELVAKARVYTRYFVWVVVALDIWMILMTAIWFHTWPEKVSGLLLSAASVWNVYFLPDMVPLLRQVVGGLS